MTTLKGLEKIKRAIIQIQKRNSFFAYLSLYLKFEEVKKGEMSQDTMGVDVKGNCYYVKEFVDKITDEELQGVITHEIGHLVFLSDLRRGNRDKIGWNCATDLAINTLLKNNNFTLPKPNICADYNDELKIPNGKTIKKCSELTAEQIFDKFPKIKQQGVIYVTFSKDGKKGGEIGGSFDVHIEMKDGDGKGKGKDGKKKKDGLGGIGGLSEKEKREIEKDWLDKIQEAIVVSKMKGDIPKGIERLCEALHREEIDWKALLQRYVMNSIPYDFSWNKPHKKSISTGVYMPNILKEKIKVGVCIDVSGSIGQQELTDFLSEIIGIARAFQERIDMTLYTHEVEVVDKFEVTNGSIEQIKNLKIKGGGGTAFQPVIEHINEDLRDTKALIWLTDGYGDKVSYLFFLEMPLLFLLSHLKNL